MGEQTKDLPGEVDGGDPHDDRDIAMPSTGDSPVGIDRSSDDDLSEDDLPAGDDDGMPDDDGYFTEDLEQPLSDEQLKVVAHELATTIRERGRVKMEMSDAAKRYRDQIEALDAQIDAQVVTIETSKRRVPVRCRRVAHAERPFWQYVRTDTGEVYDEDPMSPEEVIEQRQMALPGVASKAVAP